MAPETLRGQRLPIYLDPPNPRKISVFSEFDLYRLILPKTPISTHCIFFGLGETKAEKCLQQLKRLREDSHKKTQEPANPEILLFLTSQKT